MKVLRYKCPVCGEPGELKIPKKFIDIIRKRYNIREKREKNPGEGKLFPEVNPYYVKPHYSTSGESHAVVIFLNKEGELERVEAYSS